MTLYELLQLLKEHLKLVIFLPIACALVMAVAAFGFMANQYTASTSMYVLSKSSADTTTTTQSDLSASQLITNDVAALLKSDRVTNDAADTLGLTDLKAYTVAITNSTTNRVITIKVTGKEPVMTAKVANALTNSVASVVKEVMDVQSVNVIDEAQTPTTPSGPNRLMYIAVAFLAGLFVAIAIVVLLDMLNTRVRSSEELEQLLGITVIGRMPAMKEGK